MGMEIEIQLPRQPC